MLWLETILVLIFQICLAVAGVKINNWLWWPISLCFILFGAVTRYGRKE